MSTVARTSITSFTGEYEFLSNFSRAGGLLPAEYYFQARKAVMTGREDQLDWILAAVTPGEAKRRGRQVQLPPDWDAVSRREMLDVLLDKFSCPELGAVLIATRPAVLVEGNRWGDDFWGAIPWDRATSGLADSRPVWTSGHGYLYGHNWLGRILMMVRDVLG